MNIFVTGANGFIGSHLVNLLHLAGHRVRCCVRHPHKLLGASEVVAIDFERAVNALDWLPYLTDIDAVINTVGIFTEHGSNRFDTIHDEAPRALFAACAIANVARVVQVSALGATTDANTEFLRSKARADAFLLERHLCALVLQPSLVFGSNSESSQLFVALASLPLIILPDGGIQLIQPVHIDDIGTAILRFVETAPHLSHSSIAAVGPRALSVRTYIDILRGELGKAPGRVLSISSKKISALSRRLPLPWLQPDTLQMLQRGNYADAGAFSALLQREPRSPEQFGADILRIRKRQRIRIAVNFLRGSMALLWIVTGFISLGIFPVEEGAALLGRVGFGGSLQVPLLYSAALLDIALGIAIICIHRPWIAWIQSVVIIFYSVVIAWKLPEFWLHPFAPLLKNIPLLAAIYLIACWDRQRPRKASHVRTD